MSKINKNQSYFNMITEQYVTFETARLLKEAGFNCLVKRYFRIPGFSSEPKEMSVLTAMNINREPRSYSCPTQALAARWLREMHHIFIMSNPMIDGWLYDLFDLKKHQYILCNKAAFTENYEEAYEAALQEALKLIIKKK